MMNLRPAQIVSGLLGEDNWVEGMLGEASVHRPHRGHIYVASFTGPAGGQRTKSTGTAEPLAALVVAREFEAAARAERAKAGSAGQRQRIRNRQFPGSVGGGLTQPQVAAKLGLSVRGVREIERRALAKLAQHPELLALWREYLAGELTEQDRGVCAPEIGALLGLARSPVELETILGVLELILG
jgi:hypothetical protein